MSRNPPQYYQHDYPDVSPAVEQLKQGNSSHVEPALCFLERDPYKQGTGYIKEKIWRYLLRVDLTDKQRQRLRAVALLYVKTRSSREFFPMCRFINRIADEKFQQQLNQLQTSDNFRTRQRAWLLNAYLQSLSHGEKMRRNPFRD